MQPLTEWTDHDPRLLVSPPELKVVNANTDTLIINYKFVDEQGNLNGAELPGHIVTLLDDWQKAARKDHQSVPTTLNFSYLLDGQPSQPQTLMMRSHGSSLWSWLLYCEDLKVNFSHATVNKGLFCRVTFSSRLLHMLGPACSMVEVESMLYNFLGQVFHKQCSEIHLCADIQGFDFSRLSLLGEHLPFVTRVVNIRDRVAVPSEQEQEGGLTPKGITKLEQEIKEAEVQPDTVMPASVLTTHRRVATIDFGSHGSEIMGQIYNKSLEIKKHRKEWFEPLWLANGWDGVSIVWRVEFRFRRAALRRFDLDEAFSTLDCIHLLWRYATEEWLRLVDLDASTGLNISRLPTHPVWEVIQHAYDHMNQPNETLDPVGEREARITQLVQDKPLQVIEQAVQIALYNELQPDEVAYTADELAELDGWDCPTPASFHRCLLAFVLLYCPLEWRKMELYRQVSETGREVERSMLSEKPSVLQDIARDTLSSLPPADVERLLEHLSPVSFESVRVSLVQRAHRMARMERLVAGALGCLRSAAALMPPDEIPGNLLGPDNPPKRQLPDLLASLIWFYDKARTYDEKKHRSHLYEVLKKQLLYGMVSAQELDTLMKNHGVELQKEDLAAVEAALASLTDHSV